MLDLYTSPTPNGYKVTVALEEMGLDYNLIPVDLAKGEQTEIAIDRVGDYLIEAKGL